MESTGTEPRGDRGQLIIVISLVLATLFVALALILNSGIYAENLSTRETTDSSDVSLTIQQVDRETREAMRAANRIEESQDPDEAIGNFTASFDAVSVAVANERALRGQALDMNQTGTSGGFLLQQDNATRNYTDASRATDWTLVSDVERVSGYHLHVDRGQLADEPGMIDDPNDEVFFINLTDHSVVWRIYVYEDDNEVVLAGGNVSDDDLLDLDELEDLPVFDDEDCKAETDTAAIDLSAGTLNGTSCPALAFADNLSDEITVSYYNADLGGGTYRLLVDTEDEGDIDGEFNESPDSPYKKGAVFDASVDVTFERSDVRYSTSRNVTAEPLTYEAY